MSTRAKKYYRVQIINNIKTLTHTRAFARRLCTRPRIVSIVITHRVVCPGPGPGSISNDLLGESHPYDASADLTYV